MNEIYDHKATESRWQDAWRKLHVFEVDAISNKPKYYILEMFPYPSGTIHMGHVRNYTMGDAMARYKAARGFNVMHPMGWDAFGLPAENAAIKHKTHPAKWTYSNIAYMKRQFERMGWLFDWRREAATCAPDYYRWEQLFFIQMLEKGLAYRKLSSVNWCNSCNTVLANEQVEEGKCWRCENDVTTKELTQWFYKVTAYAEELLAGCDKLPGWDERVTTMQRHWIGKSEGAELLFEVADGPKKGVKIPVFTTRPDTVGGVSFLSLAPEHALTLELARGANIEARVAAFVDKVRKIDKIKRSAENFEKEGVALGAHVLNPVTGEKVPVFAANFVLMDYGSGAVMAVPAHDVRDHAFAKKYGLPIKQVIAPLLESGAELPRPVSEAAYTEPGRLVNSGEFTGLTSEDAKRKIPQWLEKKGAGHPTVNYKLRDWGISRQRYWGTPIPIIHCEKCGPVPVPKHELPVVLPEDVEFTGEGASPLSKSAVFVNVPCPKCGALGRRDTDTMDTFVESSWYYLRFCSLPTPDKPFRPEDVAYWGPIDQYIGGIEHATMHLLYFRFFHRVLQDLGWIPAGVAREPATNLLNQGIVYKDGAKMSKSKGNVVDPDSIIERFGADTARLFILFAAPPEKVIEWSDQGVEGSYRFIGRVWRMLQGNISLIQDVKPYAGQQSALNHAEAKKLRTKTHQTIQKVTNDLDHDFRFNTAISAIMELVNEIYSFKVELNDQTGREVLRESIETVVRLLCPFAPHVTEELWRLLGHDSLLTLEKWRDHDAQAVLLDVITIVVQVNGKHRANLTISKDVPKDEIAAMASKDPHVVAHLKDKELVRTVVVPGRLVNFVVK
ncbi:MAG: leucine--tRNA ligase [Deltaproteobacteria bacterium]|nr:leucine--tRNA ligase [Deltaproteobacteria bacterium]